MNKCQINRFKDRVDAIRRMKRRDLTNLRPTELSYEEKIGQILSGEAELRIDEISNSECPRWLDQFLQAYRYKGDDERDAVSAARNRLVSKRLEELNTYVELIIDKFILNGEPSDKLLREFEEKNYTEGL